MNVRPASATASANAAFSRQEAVAGMDRVGAGDRARRRGCARSRGTTRAPAAGPIRTASSANRTSGASASASEYTATVAMPIARAVRITRSAISPRFATSSTSRSIARRISAGTLPTRRAVHRRRVRRRQRDRDHRARVARIDDAVVPQPRGREVRVALLVDLLPRSSPSSTRELLLVDGLAALGRGVALDDVEHAGELLAAHHRDAVVRPREQEARRVRAAASSRSCRRRSSRRS